MEFREKQLMTQTGAFIDERPSPWLIRNHVNPQARLRLFCFPYAGGSSVIYRSWQERLPSTVELISIELPARGRRLREKPFTQVNRLVPAIAEELLPYLRSPFGFFGHSMGALISYELTRYLVREGGPQPVRLFLSGRRAPQIPNEDSPTYNLPEAEFVTELRRMNGTPAEVLDHTELLQLVIPLLRADFEVCQTYAHEPGPPLACPITAFGGSHDQDVTHEHLTAWAEQTTGDFVFHLYPGDHFFIHSSQSLVLRTLNHELEACLRQL
jgi:medium-chain acyl-[acyl-carrier-protein] hydrolase